MQGISDCGVWISQDPSGNRDDAIERVTRRGLPKRGVANVESELAYSDTSKNRL